MRGIANVKERIRAVIGWEEAFMEEGEERERSWGSNL